MLRGSYLQNCFCHAWYEHVQGKSRPDCWRHQRQQNTVKQTRTNGSNCCNSLPRKRARSKQQAQHLVRVSCRLMHKGGKSQFHGSKSWKSTGGSERSPRSNLTRARRGGKRHKARSGEAQCSQSRSKQGKGQSVSL